MDDKKFLNFIKYCFSDSHIIPDRDYFSFEEFAKIVSFNRLENYFANSSKLNKLNLSQKLQNSLLNKAQERNIKSMSCFSSAIKISDVLAKYNFDYIFLKAVALYIYDNKNISIRSTSDIDIFIPKYNLDEAVKILISEGYNFATKYPLNNSEWKGSLDFKTDIILKDQDGNLVEIHSSLFKPGHGTYNDFEISFLKNGVNNHSIYKNLIAPSHSNYILHIIYNYTKHSFYCSGMRYLLDISYLANNFEICWEKIINESGKIGIADETKITIMILKELELIKPVEIPDLSKDLQKSLKPALKLSFYNNSSNNLINFFSGSYFDKIKLILHRIVYFSKEKISYKYNIESNSIYIYLFYLIYMYSEIIKLSQKYQSVNKREEYYRLDSNEKNFFQQMKKR